MSSPGTIGWNSRLVVRGVAVCLVVKIATWIAGAVLAHSLPFDRANYFGNFGHYAVDPRAVRLAPEFLSLWNYSDSEWYLTLADHGYPDLLASPECDKRPDFSEWQTEKHCKHKWAFFPMYPLAIAAFASFLPLLAAAFVATTLIGLAAAACFVMAFGDALPERADESTAATALLLLYPFAIFYQLYFSEALFLLLSLLAFVCFWRKHYLAMLACGALLTTTRALGVFIVIPLLVGVLRSDGAREDRVRAGLCALVIPLGLLPWMWFNFHHTGDWRYFSTAQKLWGYENQALLANLWHNVVGVAGKFPQLDFHRFHKSQLDYVTMWIFALVLIAMWRRRDFPRELTVWSTLLWLVPLASKDLMSFGRYMCVSFPVFMYLAVTPRRGVRRAVLAVFAVGYAVALVGIINYAWVG